MSVKIKDFGNDTTCDSLESLQKTLSERYANRSITLLHTAPSGLNISKFIDVDANGNAIGTYDKLPVNLNTLHFHS